VGSETGNGNVAALLVFGRLVRFLDFYLVQVLVRIVENITVDSLLLQLLILGVLGRRAIVTLDLLFGLS
jgi:hypothetical protein